MTEESLVYISYTWKDRKEQEAQAGESLANTIHQSLLADGIPCQIDNKAMDYRSDISRYAEQIGKGKIVVAIISEAYFRSRWCMEEMLNIFLHHLSRPEEIRKHLIPIVLPDFQRSQENRAEIRRFWEDKKKAVETEKGERKDSDLETEIELYANFDRNLSKVFALLTETLYFSYEPTQGIQVWTDRIKNMLKELVLYPKKQIQNEHEFSPSDDFRNHSQEKTMKLNRTILRTFLDKLDWSDIQSWCQTSNVGRLTQFWKQKLPVNVNHQQAISLLVDFVANLPLDLQQDSLKELVSIGQETVFNAILSPEQFEAAVQNFFMGEIATNFVNAPVNSKARFQSYLGSLLDNDDIEGVLAYLKENNEWNNDFTMLSARVSRLEKDQQNRLLTRGEYNIERNRILAALRSILSV